MTNKLKPSPILVISHFSVKNALREYLGILIVGALIVLAFGALSKIPGPYGAKSMNALDDFIKHAMAIDPKIFAFAGIFSAPAIAFRGHELAILIRNYVSKPFVGFLAHTASLGTGALIGLGFLCLLDSTVTKHTLTQIGSAALIFSILFIETFFAFLSTEESVTKKYLPEMPYGVFAIAGLIIPVGSVTALAH